MAAPSTTPAGLRALASPRHVSPEIRIFRGPDSLAHLPAELARVGSRRAVIVTGQTLSRAGSCLDLVRDALGDYCAGVYAGVRSDSPVPAVQEAALELHRLKADAVVAVGGGSAIVTARAAAILLAESEDVRALCTRQEGDRLVSPKLHAPKLPQFVVPTTPTNATVKAGSAVLDPADGTRLALFDPKTRAKALFLHPELMASASRTLCLSAGLNTLTLAIEGLLSRAGDPMSDAMLMHAVRLLARQLPAASHSDEPQIREDLMFAAILCGRGSDHTGAGMAIPVGHAVATRHHVAMGVSDAIVLPFVLRFNAGAAPAGIAQLADALGVCEDDAQARLEAVIAVLQGLFKAAGVPLRLRDAGVPHAALPELAAIAMGDWYLRNNPRPIHDVAQVQGVLEQAW